MKKIALILTVLFSTTFFAYASETDSGVDTTFDWYSMSLDDLLNVEVVTSSRKAERSDEAPNVIHVITKEEIKRRGYSTYKDILTTIPGFNVFHGDLGYMSQVRGIAPNMHNKVTYMVNGRQINQYRETNMLVGPVSLDNVERIEIVVGPGSVLYGAETLLAIVNIITSHDIGNQVTARVGQGFGDDSGFLGQRSGNINLNKTWDTLKYVNFSMTGMVDEGWTLFDTIEISNPKSIGRTGQVGAKHFPSYFVCADARLEEYSFQFVSFNAEIEGIGGSGAEGTEGVRIDKVDDFMIKHEKQRTDIIDTRVQFNYANKRSSRRPSEGFVGNATDLAYTEYNFELASNYTLGDHYIQTGIKSAIQQNQFNYFLAINATDQATDFANTRARQFVEYGDTYTVGGYISEAWKVNDKIKVNVASRFDYNAMFGTSTVYMTPRVALILKPTDFWTTKAMFNTSTHMPDPTGSPLNTIHGADNPNAPGFAKANNLAQKPERLQAYEFQNIFYIKNHRVSANLFYQELDDFISWFNPTTNMGNFSGYGVELEWKGKVSEKILGWSNASYNITDFELTANKHNDEANLPSNEAGEALAVPKLTVNTGVDINIYKTISLSLVSKYFTQQPTIIREYDEETGTINPIEGDHYIDNQFYLDATVLYSDIAGKPIDFGITAKNITDNTEKVAAQYRAYRYTPRGRIISATARVRF